MANATAPQSLVPAPASQSVFDKKPSTALQATYPLPLSGKPFGVSESRAARASAQAKRRQWAEMNLRQNWADEAFMRDHLRIAGIVITVTAEPACVQRVKAKLYEAGVRSPEVQAAIGMPVDRWLSVNPRLPLWAAVALILESTGRFTLEVVEGDSSDAVATATPATPAAAKTASRGSA